MSGELAERQPVTLALPLVYQEPARVITTPESEKCGVVGSAVGRQGGELPPAEPLFKAVHPEHILVLAQHIGDGAKVILCAAVTPRPPDALPLQEISRHQISVGIAGRSLQVPAGVA